MTAKLGDAFADAASPETVRKAEQKLHQKVDTHRGVIGFPRWTKDVLVRVCVLGLVYACPFVYAWGWCHLFPFGPCRDNPDMPGEVVFRRAIGWFGVCVKDFVDTYLYAAMRLSELISGQNLSGLDVPPIVDLLANLYDFMFVLLFGTIILVLVVGCLYSLLLVCVLGGFRPLIQRVSENHKAKTEEK